MTFKEHILVVDDEIFIRESIADYLSDSDFTVDTADCGEEALKKAEQSEYDLIITDLSMPGIGGMELIKRTNTLYPTVPKIIVSGRGDMKDAIDAIRYGAYDYIIKPVEDFEQFLLTVQRALEKRRLTIKNIEYQKELEKTNKLLQENIKELEETQAQLVQSAKMASLGILSAGIAHEINNPNAFVNSNLQTLKEYTKNIKKFVSSMEEIENFDSLKEKFKIDFILNEIENTIDDSLEGSNRIKFIVKDLKEFSRLDKPDLEIYDLNSGIKSSLNILRNELRQNIRVIEDYGALPLIKCHPRQLNQVFMNLIMNALQVLQENGGELEIKTRVENNEIVTSIRDNGCGITPENMAKIFDPFFTTKDVGKGMGLGLSLSYKIVEKHDGRLEVASEVGKGTTFSVYIPVIL